MPGAIWGEVRLQKQQVDRTKISEMKQSMKEYKIDRMDCLMKEHVCFCCAHQYVIRGSEKERLPFYDESNRIYFTADCILDNRKELLTALSETVEDMPDGELAYLAFLKWGEAFVQHLVGIFSFAIYQETKNQVLLYTDHTGSRCINYCLRQGDFVFSTTYGPILQAFGEENMRLCEQWMAGCEAFRAPDMILFPGLTPFEGVYQLEAGHYLRVTLGKIEKKQYWNPQKSVKKLVLQEDEDYKKLFLETFQSCVNSMLRSAGKTAMTLSSGLDSSAVACVAAPLLEKRGEVLFSYTSVPLNDFICVEGYDLMDESAGPKLLTSMYPNLHPKFVSCEGKAAFSEIERFVRCTEVPGKSNANLLWLDEIYRQAGAQGCRLVLKGQYGNSTISYGAILSLVYQRLQKLQVSEARTAIRDFKTRRRVTSQNVWQVMKTEWKNKWKPDLSMVEDSFLQERLKNKYRIRKVIRRMLRQGGGSVMDSEQEHKNFMSDLRIFQHLGLYDTKLGLAHGIILRDPTKDKRMIEFCMSLPMECFVNHGVERRMVREYMEDIVPQSIREDVSHRGLQSADFVFRLNKKWDEWKGDVLNLLSNPSLNRFLDRDRLEKLRKELYGLQEIPDKAMAQDITVLQSLSLFLLHYKNVK